MKPLATKRAFATVGLPSASTFQVQTKRIPTTVFPAARVRGTNFTLPVERKSPTSFSFAWMNSGV